MTEAFTFSGLCPRCGSFPSYEAVSCGDPSPICPQFGTHGHLYHQAEGDEGKAWELYCLDTDPWHRAKYATRVLSEVFPLARIHVMPLPCLGNESIPLKGRLDQWSIQCKVGVHGASTWIIYVEGYAHSPTVVTSISFTQKETLKQTGRFNTEVDILGYLSWIRSQHLPNQLDHADPHPPYEPAGVPFPYARELALKQGWEPGKTPSEMVFDIAEDDDPVSFKVRIQFARLDEPQGYVTRYTDAVPIMVGASAWAKIEDDAHWQLGRDRGCLVCGGRNSQCNHRFAMYP